MPRKTDDKKHKTLPSKLDNPDINLCALMDQANDIIYRAVELEIEKYKVTLAQARVLYLLARNESRKRVTLADLSNWMLREPNSISSLMTRMENAGLVEKTRDAAENRIYVTLTDKGRDLLMNKLTENSMTIVMSALTPLEKQRLNIYLKKLRRKGREVLGIDLKPPFLS
jgi:DNA-binding MarR family transcriptional regulator